MRTIFHFLSLVLLPSHTHTTLLLPAHNFYLARQLLGDLVEAAWERLSNPPAVWAMMTCCFVVRERESWQRDTRE